MKHLREIKFKTNEAKSRFNEGKTCFQGKIIHNLTLDEKTTLQEFCEYCHIGDAMPPMIVNMLGLFIAKQLAQGNRLDFGPFSVSINLRGGFSAANSPFDANHNSLSVEITPSAILRKALGKLKPVNIEPLAAKIYSVCQIDPELKDDNGHTIWDTLQSDGSRVLSVGAYPVEVHAEHSDEGVWLENDDGEVVLTGIVVECDYSLCRIRFESHLDKGSYWLVTQARDPHEDKLLRSKRRITVI